MVLCFQKKPTNRDRERDRSKYAEQEKTVRRREGPRRRAASVPPPPQLSHPHLLPPQLVWPPEARRGMRPGEEEAL